MSSIAPVPNSILGIPVGMNAGMVILVPALSWIDTILVDARLPSTSITRRSIIWRTSLWLLFCPLFKLRAYAPSRFKRCRLRVDMPPIDEPGKAWGLIQSFDSGPHNVVFFFSASFFLVTPPKCNWRLKYSQTKTWRGMNPSKSMDQSSFGLPIGGTFLLGHLA